MKTLKAIKSKIIEFAKRLKLEITTLYVLYKERQLNAGLQLLTILVLAYALSPIDLIPDFVPVLGYLDDFILLPLAIKGLLKLIPDHLYRESKIKAQFLTKKDLPKNWGFAVFVVIIWLLLIWTLFRVLF
ncbi:YkvA family protein [Fusibacter ferrireducens]|uniref:DUF1232 domain-containing protein n=1 Tax=Fusibacter ferrireducens TaxID=2785058 RepID=A0ABR9ZTS4_9FIRM|nr:DUF1232 domain-containing protein [Fusibacter ferrireducens]MBF4693880.1 DUF1232 domain-containing protein [Fusibacter ferrireducens]